MGSMSYKAAQMSGNKNTKVEYKKDRFGEIDYAATSAQYPGGNSTWDGTYKTVTSENSRTGGTRTRTVKNLTYTFNESKRNEVEKAKAADTGYAGRQQSLLSSNAQTDNTNQVQTGEDINIGVSDKPEVTGGAGKRRKQGKGGMSATLGIT